VVEIILDILSRQKEKLCKGKFTLYHISHHWIDLNNRNSGHSRLDSIIGFGGPVEMPSHSITYDKY